MRKTSEQARPFLAEKGLWKKKPSFIDVVHGKSRDLVSTDVRSKLRKIYLDRD